MYLLLLMKNKEEKKEIRLSANSKTYIFISIFLVLLVVTNIGVYKLGERNRSISVDSSKFPLLSPMSAIIDQKDMIINVQDLRDELTLVGDENPNISIYFEFLNTGANIAVNKDVEFFPASLLKLPLAMTAVKKIERGEWKWNNELVLMGPDKDNRFGELYKQPIGTLFTIEELVNEMLLNSDNTAYLMVLRNLEPDEFQKTQEHLGLQDFFSKSGKISAKKYAVILRSLYTASYLNREDSNKLITIITETKFKEYLGSAISDGIAFAHKIGVSTEENVYLDAGIVYVPKRPFLLSVMIQTQDKSFAEKKMYEISQKVFNYITSYQQEN